MPAINELLQQGRYRIIQPLGQNGIGAVYEAYDNVRETSVLFKEISVNLRKVTTPTQQEALRRRFADEAKILTGIRHESLLPVYDYFSEIDRHYLVMEMTGGNTPGELMEKAEKPLALSDVTLWAEQLLDALHYLHTQTPPVIHRDIKPQNLKLTADGKIKLALSIQNPDTKVNAIAANQTLHYLPLEQIWVGLDSASQKVILNSYDEKSERILEQPADAKSDIYALGATLYHLLTARLPVDALERSIELLEGKPDPLTRPEQINPAIAPEISDILMKALEIKRENRFDSAVIMRQAWRTAFVRVREREALTAKKPDEDVLEIPFAELRDLKPERRKADRDRLETEAEKARQLELIKRRLEEAEAERLKAEQRAAEAEKRLAEKQSKAPVSSEAPATILELPADFIKAAPAAAAMAVASPDVVAYSAEQAAAHDEFQDLFASAAPKDNKTFGRMLAVAAALVILCGAGWGVWVLLKSKSIEPNQATSSQMSLTETSKPAPTVEAAPSPSVETTPETSAIQTPDAPATDATETTVNSPTLKNKPVSTALPKAKKPTLPAATKPADKKPVTVDDIINDNN